MGDVKTAARESGKMKWQEMWEKTEKGRYLFNYRNKVGLNLDHKYQSTKGEISIIQLRTGYVRLNEYLQKTNIVESNKCQCSHIESISHYLLECPIYENQREKLMRKLFETCGIPHLDLNLLLNVKTVDDYKKWRTLILSELEKLNVSLHDRHANSYNMRTTKYREIIQVLTILTLRRYQCVYMALRLYTQIVAFHLQPVTQESVNGH